MPCSCRASATSAKAQSACGLNDDERLITLDSIRETGPGTIKMKWAARSFIDEPFGMLTIFGSYGNAKTVTLMAIVNECLKGGVPAVYVTFPSLLDYIRDSFNSVKQTGEYAEPYYRAQRFFNARVLAIDELEDAHETEWMLEFEKSLFDRRYRDGSSRKSGTVLAMNKAPRLFLPGKIVSRLYDGRNTVIENNDKDFRPLRKR